METIRETRQITNFIRDEFRYGLDINDQTKVDSSIKKFRERYDCSPELFVFLVQKMNSLALFNKFREADGKIVYPTITPLSVNEVGKRNGYADKMVLDIVSDNFKERRLRTDNKKVSMCSSEFIGELRKAAHNNEEMAKFASQDSRVRQASAFVDNDLSKKFADLCFEIGRPNMESYIKAACLESDLFTKSVLNELRKEAIMVKVSAGMSDFMQFKSKLREYVSLRKSVGG